MGDDPRWNAAAVIAVEAELGVELPARFRRYVRRDGRMVLGPERILRAFRFLSALGERLLGRPLRADRPFQVAVADLPAMVRHHERREPGMGLDHLLFPSDGWLPVIDRGLPSASHGNACDVLVTAGELRGRMFYADYGYRWWWPYLAGHRVWPGAPPAVLSFAGLRRTRRDLAETGPGPQDAPRPWCPGCGSRALPALYGSPGPVARSLAEAGEVILAGCLTSPASPRWICPDCQTGLGRRAGTG